MPRSVALLELCIINSQVKVTQIINTYQYVAIIYFSLCVLQVNDPKIIMYSLIDSKLFRNFQSESDTYTFLGRFGS